MLGISCVGVFNSGLFIASPVAFSLRVWCCSIQTSRSHKLANCLEPEVPIPFSHEPVMGFYPVPHESSPHIIMIYLNIILLSVPRSLNGSFNVVYTKYISDSEQYQTRYHYKYTRELSCRKGTSCSYCCCAVCISTGVSRFVLTLRIEVAFLNGQHGCCVTGGACEGQ